MRPCTGPSLLALHNHPNLSINHHRFLLSRERLNNRHSNHRRSNRFLLATINLCKTWELRWVTVRVWSTSISTRLSRRSLCHNSGRPGCSSCEKSACAASNSASGAISGVCSRTAYDHPPNEMRHPALLNSPAKWVAPGILARLDLLVIQAIPTHHPIRHRRRDPMALIYPLKCRPHLRSPLSRCPLAYAVRSICLRSCKTARQRYRREMG